MSSNSALGEIAAALAECMSPRDRLAGWSFRWSLSDGQLTCSQCQASQSAHRAGEAFAHRAGCHARRDENPWDELANLMARLP
jgi:hypothetical protein